MNTALVILSAEQAGLTAEQNDYRTQQLEQLLALYQLPARRVCGMYNGTSEASFVVPLPVWHAKAMEVEQLLASITFGFDQECYLLSHADRTCELVYQDRRVPMHGKLRAITPTKAGELDSYTVTDTSEYFAVV